MRYATFAPKSRFNDAKSAISQPMKGADQESDPDETMLPHHERYTTDRHCDTDEVAHELKEEAHQGLSKRDMASNLNSSQFYIEKVKRHSFSSKLCVEMSPNCSLLSAAQCCVGLFLLLLLARFWLLVALYVLWLYLDWETPQTGGRRWQWVRNWTVWKHFKEYFPIKIIKTVDLDPQHNYLMGFHPHGVLVAGAFGNFCTNYTEFKDLFPGLTPYLHILPFWFRCPFFREYIMCVGKCIILGPPLFMSGNLLEQCVSKYPSAENPINALTKVSSGSLTSYQS
ncbi:unnamed protein product [Ranitomeya imitator]|uniref:2-acylglycerol O-acyltransferase 1 n=1 Tax=Ranitomeya imitator TaxID=111125 RepID=A0ABN9LTW8_9NEOB|nr:unnamed protein product [Ranitomeya imitator]